MTTIFSIAFSAIEYEFLSKIQKLVRTLIFALSIFMAFIVAISCNKKTDDIAPDTATACLEEDTLLGVEDNDWFKENFLYDFNKRSLVKSEMTSISIPEGYESFSSEVYSGWETVGKFYDGSDSVDVNLYFEIGSNNKLAYLGIATSFYEAYNEAHPDESLNLEGLNDHFEEIQPDLDTLGLEGPNILEEWFTCRNNCNSAYEGCQDGTPGSNCAVGFRQCIHGCNSRLKGMIKRWWNSL